MIRKAVITAAGKGTRMYPGTNAVQKELFPLVDIDGIAKPTIQIIAEQAWAAGIEELCIVVQPGEAEQFRRHFKGLTEPEKNSFKNKSWGLAQSDLLEKLQKAITYVEQKTQDGFGHAVYCAHEWASREPFMLLLGDHVYHSDSDINCFEQAISVYHEKQKTVYGVHRTPIDKIHLYGTVAGIRDGANPKLYALDRMVEKPDETYARAHLVTAGLPENFFLTFFGIYLFTPGIFDVLKDHIDRDVRSRGEIQLTTAQHELMRAEGAYGLEIEGEKLDMGTPLGYVQTQLALARKGVFKEQYQGEL